MNLKQKENAIKSLLNGDNFHFGSPLDLFLNKCQTGYFTKNRENCEKFDKEISIINHKKYQAELVEYFRSPGHSDRAK